MAAGMIPGFKTPDVIELERLRRQQEADEATRLERLARMNPFEQARHEGLQSAQMIGRGLGGMIATAAGRDPRSAFQRNVDTAQKNLDAMQAAKEEAAAAFKLDPNDPASVDAFYRQWMSILARKGFPFEAAAVAKEWEAQKRQGKQLDLQNEELQRKKARDIATDQRAQERNRILEQKGMLGVETIQLLNRLDLIDPLDPTKQAERDYITKRLNALGAGKGVKFVPLGDRVQIVDAVTGEEIRTETVGQKPAAPMNAKDAAKQDEKNDKAASAYKEAKAAYQNQYDAAVALHNHPGLEGITGRVGRFVGEPGTAGQVATTAAGAQARAALNLWQQVTGSTFIAALAQLKAASPTGSTGLGAVSDAEGKKVQAAAAALGREQDAADLRRQLAIYIQTLVDSANRLDATAQAQEIAPIPLAKKPLTAPGKSARPTPTPAPSPAPAPSSGAGWTPEKQRRLEELRRKQGK